MEKNEEQIKIQQITTQDTEQREEFKSEKLSSAEQQIQEQSKGPLEKMKVETGDYKTDSLMHVEMSEDIEINTTIPCRIEKKAMEKGVKIEDSKDVLAALGELIKDQEAAKNPMFFEMQKVLRNYLTALHKNTEEKGDGIYKSTEERLALLIQVKTATSGYMGTYTNWFTKRKGRYKNAAVINSFAEAEISKIYDDLMQKKKEEKENTGAPAAEPEEVFEEATLALTSLQSLKGSYDAYCKKIDSSVLDGEVEKLRKKVQFFKNYDANFKALESLRAMDRTDKKLKTWCNKRGNLSLEKIDTAFSDLKTIYDKLVFEYTILSKTKKVVVNKGLSESEKYKEDLDKVYENDLTSQKTQAKKIELDKNVDKTLTKEQLKCIQDIDNWIVRNMFNGGGLGLVLGVLKTDYSALANELFSLTKRERLTIYYLICERKRNSANAEDILEAQSYKPDLSVFKDKMLASKVLLTSRVTADGYVYWQKIGEALRATRHLAPFVELYSLNEEDLTKKMTESNDAGETKEEKKDSSQLNNAATRILGAVRKLKEGNLSKEERKEQNDLIMNAITEIDAVSEKYKDVLRDYEGKGNQVSKAVTVNKVARDLRNINQVAKNSKLILKISAFQKLSTFVKGINFTTAGGNAINGVLSAIASIAVLTTNAGMSWGEFFTEGTRAASGVADAVFGGFGAYYYAEKGYEFMKELPGTMKIVGGVAAGLKMGVGAIDIFRSAGQMKRCNDMQKALEEKHKGKSQEDKEYRFEKGMLDLAQNLARRKARMGGMAVLVGGALLGSVLGPAGIISTVLVGASVGLDVLNVGAMGNLKSIRELAFDSYFGLNNFYENRFKEINEDRKANNQKELSDKEKYRLKLDIRTRISLDKGFSSRMDAQNFIAGEYAQKIRYALFEDKENREENEKVYVPLVNALGLKYKPESDKPTEEAIKKKFAGT